ncbi:MAG TPA: hypothetical protein V6D48_05830 [Oculatellaceae cyanobacterium]
MEKIIFYPCDNDITRDAKTPTISRVNPQSLPCIRCGSTERKLGAGKTSGSGSLLCECGKFIKWVSGSELHAIASQLKGGLR